MNITDIIIPTLFFILGFIFKIKIDILKKNRNDIKILKETKEKFNDLLKKLSKSRVTFLSRVNQTVILETDLNIIGSVNIVYLMDKEMVCIFKDNKCIYTSDLLEKDFNDNLMNKIHEKFGSEINDVVDILGVTISRVELDSKLKEFEDKYPKIDMTKFNKKEISDIEEIIEENEKRLDIDIILDKINKVGMDKLTKEELIFLKTQSNK